MPDAYVCRSSEVLPQIKEYDRVCTTIVNAYVGPVLERYLTRLATRLSEAGFAGPVLIIQSHGGVATIAEAVRLAAGSVLSGPAGGVAGSRYAARLVAAWRSHPVRHGRHLDRHLAHRRRRSRDHVRPPPRRPARRPAEPGYRQHRRRRRLNRPGRCRRRPARRSRERRRDRQGPPAMAAAGRRRRSPMPTSFSASSIRTISLAGARISTAARPKPLSTYCAENSASTVWPLPRAFIASSTRAWRRASGSSRFGAASIPALRDPVVRRCRRPARHRRRAPTRSAPRDRTAARRRPVGMGHARLRPALRDRAHPHRRCQPPRCWQSCAPPSGRWRRRAALASERRLTPGRSTCNALPTCATASRYSR